jgi:acetyltransferase-like isoleucine patch superfamily enzyme
MHDVSDFSAQFQENRLAFALDAPWRITNEVRRLAMWPFIRTQFALNGIAWGQGWRILGMPLIQRHRGSVIRLGERITLRSWRSSNPLTPNHAVVLATRTSQAVIQIGDDCGFTGATLVAAERIEIGHRVQVGANSTIADTDFHPLTAAERARDFMAGAHAPIVIEDDVFIGMQSLILKGVTIGRGSVVGAGSVVTRNVPPGVVVAGNPARIIKHLES